MSFAYELGVTVMAFLIAQGLWTYVFHPIALIHPLASAIIAGCVVSVLVISVLLRRTGKVVP